MSYSRLRGITRSITILLVVVIIIVAGVAGIAFTGALNHSSSTSSTTTTTSTQSLQDVTMGFAGVPDVTDTPGFMLWQNFANQLGLNIHVQYYDGDTTVADAVVAGNVQIGEGGFQAVLAADETQGNSSGSYPFVVFGSYEASNDFGLLVSNSIKNFSDLAGKPVAISSVGSTSYIFCQLLEQNNGLSASQINCAPTGGTPSRYTALLNGKVVGDITEPFYMVAAVESGGYHILATVPSVVPNLLFSTLYTSRTYMTAHPDVVLKLEEATLLADRWAHNESVWVQKEQEEFPGTNATIAGAAWKIWMAMNIWAPNGGLSTSNLNYSTNFYLGIHKVSYYLAPSYWSTLSVQSQGLQSLGNYTACPVLVGCPDSSIPSLNFSIPGVSSAILPGGTLALNPSVTGWDSTSFWRSVA